LNPPASNSIGNGRLPFIAAHASRLRATGGHFGEQAAQPARK
jgi:hypothetical protein